MFERYTEKARRVIFFSRYEASQFGSPYIETEHLLLGIMREDIVIVRRLKLQPESIRRQIEEKAAIRAKVSTTVDLPLSNEGKRVLAYAAEEAHRMSDRHIGTEHLLLGLLREENCWAAVLLRDAGLRIEAVRNMIAQIGVEAPHSVSRAGAVQVVYPTESLEHSLTKFIEGSQTLPVTAKIPILPQTGDEIVLEFDDGQRLFRVESVRFILQRDPEEGPGAQALHKIQVHVTSIGE